MRICDIRRETTDCVSIAFEVPESLRDEYRYIPGQHLTLKTIFNREEIRRSYSICSHPLDGELRVAIKHLKGGTFSTLANQALKVGDTLDVMTPMGHFYASHDSPDKQRHYVAFAAGSGITPIISILQATLHQEPSSRFTLFYGNRTVDSIIFHEKLEGLKNIYLQRLSIYYILSKENPGNDLFAGRINAQKCRTFTQKLFDPESVDDFFLCGPQEMTEEVRQTLLESGVDRKNIHQELFHTGEKAAAKRKVEIATGPTIQSQITVTLDSRSFEFPLATTGASILDAALQAGADLPFACKGGVCCTCRAKLREGNVTMEVNYALEPDEVAAGYILTCQSHPTSARVAVDFDS